MATTEAPNRIAARAAAALAAGAPCLFTNRYRLACRVCATRTVDVVDMTAE